MINVTGVSESRVAPAAAYYANQKDQSIIIVSTDVRAKRLASDLSFFVQDKEIITLPEEEQFLLRYAAKNQDHMLTRLRALKALRTGQPVVVIAPASAAVKKIAPHSSFEKSSFRLRLGEEVDLDKIKGKLVALGYERREMIDARGQFSVRGGILDIYTPDGETPYRIEFFGAEVDSIRAFDIDSQRSLETLQSVEIYPAEEILSEREIFQSAEHKIGKAYREAAKKAAVTSEELSEKIRATGEELREYAAHAANLQLLENYIHYFYDHTEYLWDYMDDGCVMIDDPERVEETLQLRTEELREDFGVMLERGQVIAEDAAVITDKTDFRKVYSKPDTVVFTPFPKRVAGVDSFDRVYNLQSRQVLTFHGKMNVLESELKAYVKKGYRVTIVCSSQERLENLREFADRIGLLEKLNFAQGSLTAGIDLPTEKVCYISESDIFETRKKTRRKKYKDKGQKLQSFSDMREGDFVVHENHGIGKFVGIEQLTVQGEKKDYIKINYAGSDCLYVPATSLDLVSKYIGGGDEAAEKTRLNSFPVRVSCSPCDCRKETMSAWLAWSICSWV